jgi:hypothetical protein
MQGSVDRRTFLVLGVIAGIILLAAVFIPGTQGSGSFLQVKEPPEESGSDSEDAPVREFSTLTERQQTQFKRALSADGIIKISEQSANRWLEMSPTVIQYQNETYVAAVLQ